MFGEAERHEHDDDRAREQGVDPRRTSDCPCGSSTHYAGRQDSKAYSWTHGDIIT